MAQFTPSKKTIKDFNDGEEYLNKIDVVQADTINNLVEGLLYAQENGGGEGVDGTIMLTEGREGGKVLRENDYYLEVLDGTGTVIRRLNSFYRVEQDSNALSITESGVEKGQELIIEAQETNKNNMLRIGD